MSSITRILLFIVVLCAPLGAWAQPNGDDARAHFEKGKSLATSGKYADAYREFEASYQAQPKPALLFNMAEAARGMGDTTKARDAYNRYLAAEPTGTLADTARKRLADLGPKPADQAPPAKPIDQSPSAKPVDLSPSVKPVDKPTPPPTASLNPATASVPTPREAAEHHASSDARETRQSEPHRTTQILKWGGVGVAALGVGLIAIGVSQAVAASNSTDKLESSCTPSCTWGDEQIALQSEHDSHRRNAIIFSSIGTVSVIAGGAAAYLGWRQGKTDERVALDVKRGHASVVWAWSF